jgi:arylsulfatase A-like enzyme
LLDAVNRRDIASDTLIVFASDHGELSHSHWRISKREMFEELINVPLAMRRGSRLGSRQDAPTVVSTVDLAPTIAGLTNAAGLDAHLREGSGRPVQGRDLSGFLLRGRGGGAGAVGYLDEHAYVAGKMATDGEWRALRKRRWVLSVDRHFEPRRLVRSLERPLSATHSGRQGAGCRAEAPTGPRENGGPTRRPSVNGASVMTSAVLT